MIRYFVSYIFIYTLWLIRRVVSRNGKTYLIMFSPLIQPFLSWIARVRSFAIFYRAKRTCPAYRDFLESENYDESGKWSLSRVPVMTKENYVKKYSIEERCYFGKIPAPGTVIDESSGSSGIPNNWIRNRYERDDVKRILQLNYEIIYADKDCILLNCFALGPWATGMNVSMSLVDVGILKSIGPDAKKLENTLSLLGPSYRYMIFGYPPFLKSWLDSTKLDLSQFTIDAVVGGEGMSEGLRSFLLKHFQTVISSYGASDLEINIAVETELTIALRRMCFENHNLSEKLFGRENPPMIFQYNPADYIIESLPTGELLYTILRLVGAAPKIRYNLGDLGGVIAYNKLATELKENGHSILDLAKRQSSFPILYVHGRGDLSVPFYGSKVFPSNIEEIVNSHPKLAGKINSFQIKNLEDADLARRLIIYLERSGSGQSELPEAEELQEILFQELGRVNQDFREVTKMFDKSCVIVEVQDFETGVFADRDIRIKNKYIG